jgi:tol-pal system protein YbgF
MNRFLIALCLTGLGASACFYPASRGRELEDRATRQEQELKDLEQKLAATLPKIDEKVAEVTKALESLDRVARQSDANVGVRLQKTVEDLGQLRGQVETYLFKIAELEKATKKIEENTEQKFGDLQGTDAGKAASTRRRFEELHKPADPKMYLAVADAKAREGEYALARLIYEDFIRKYPKGELTGDAHFGRGETFYSEDKCREALAEYGKVIQDYPKSSRAPDAYLHSADCFGKLKMKDEARLALEEVVKTYPRSEAARQAKARLAALDKSSSKKSGGSAKKAKK